jgi:GT2 family glycosyltransferase
VIILNWNGGADTLACLESLQKVTYPDTQVIVVDNGSEDDSPTRIRQDFPEVMFKEMGENLGYVGGNNVGMRLAQENGAHYALLLNNDTEVSPDFLDQLVAALEADDEAGIAGPSIYYFSDPGILWSAGGEIDPRRGITRMRGMGLADRGQYGSRPRPVDFVTGCALLVRVSLLDTVGLLEERFFAYYEETEWCVRLRRHGYKCLHVPVSKIWHKISPQAREASPQVHYYMTRNRLLFLKLTRAGIQPFLRTLLEYSRTLASWSLKPRWRGKRPQRQAMLQAIRDYFRGRFGRVDATR